MMMSREPITKRPVARAMALYGTLGGLFLNCRGGEIFWGINIFSLRQQNVTGSVFTLKCNIKMNKYGNKCGLNFWDNSQILTVKAGVHDQNQFWCVN